MISSVLINKTIYTNLTNDNLWSCQILCDVFAIGLFENKLFLLIKNNSNLLATLKHIFHQHMVYAMCNLKYDKK